MVAHESRQGPLLGAIADSFQVTVNMHSQRINTDDRESV